MHAMRVTCYVDCSQSPIFSWDHLDIPRLNVKGILIFKCTEGAGVRDYSSEGGGGGIFYFSRFPPNCPRPLSSSDTNARWQPVTQSARSRWSFRIILFFNSKGIPVEKLLKLWVFSLFSLFLEYSFSHQSLSAAWGNSDLRKVTDCRENACMNSQWLGC